MTEEEARTKWCPMANIAAIGSFGYNRNTVGDPAWRSFCIASDCMRWPECLSWWTEYERKDEPIKVKIVGGSHDQ